MNAIEAFHGWNAPGMVLGVFMTDLYQRHKKSGIRVCPECGEAYAAAQGKICRSCSGKGYYRLESHRDDASSSLVDPPKGDAGPGPMDKPVLEPHFR